MLTSYRKRRESDIPCNVGRPDPNGDLNAVRAGIGTALRAAHRGVLHEEVPATISELLEQLDQHQADPV